MLEYIILITSVVGNLFIGTLTYYNDRKSLTNQLFALLTFALSGWSVLSFASLHSDSHQMLLIRLVMTFVVLMNTTFFYLVVVFPDYKYKFNFKYKILFLYAAVTMATALTPFMFTGLEVTDGNVSPIPGPGMLLFLVHTVIFVGGGMAILIKKFIQSTGKLHHQLKYITLGTVLLFTLLPITNFVLPIVFGYSGLVYLTPLYTTIFASFVGLGIIKYQLFDLRAALARSTAYVLSLGAMLIAYIVLIFGAAGFFLDDTTAIDNSQKLIYAVFAVLIAFTFQPLKNFFDKLTDKVFYREKYDPEKLLSDYTDFLVDEIETDEVISVTLSLMQEIANPVKSWVVLYRNGVAEWYKQSGPVYGDEHDELAKGLEYQSQPVYTVDGSLGRKDAFMKNIEKHMSDNKLKVSVKLSTHGQLEGFILLGDKKSGSHYNQKDLKLFTTIANELSVALQNSERFDQIERFNITLQKEVEEATARLKQTNMKLQQLDIAKDEFISMASHQLRTPLTSMKGYVSMVIDGDAGKINAEQKKLLSEAFSSSQRMVYLIADLLNVSRLKTGKFIIDRTEVDLARLVQEEVYQLAPSATTRKVKIAYVSPKTFPQLMLDETKTRQVVMNLIDNAIYYTKAGGDVTVTLVAKKDKVEYRVKDTGIGIPASDQHKLFTKFFRAANARRARPDGTGLGLYMAQKIIVAQGGSIIFKSKEKKGSTFGFNLPIKTPKDK